MEHSDIQSLKTRLRELASLNGIAGAEAEVARCVRDLLRPFADQVAVDNFGNVIALRRSSEPGPRLMIAAHSDEVGLMVRRITPDGFIRFHTMGTISPAILPATRVLVGGSLPGTIGAVAGHMEASGTPRARAVSELHIDIGARSEAEARAWGVREGTPITFQSELQALHNPDLVMGKAIDNRIGCAVLIDVFEQLQGQALRGEIYGVANVMEEMGMRGARMTAASVKPDWAIALDTVPAEDTPLSTERTFSIGHGPVVQLIEGRPEAFVGTTIHPKVRDLILEVAQTENIPVQLSAQYGNWTTDAANIHVHGEGVPTGFVSIPRRYSHSPNELLNLNDALQASRLLVALARRNSSNLSFRVIE